MNFPFTVDQFLSVFRTYNLAVWPAQVGLLLIGISCVLLAFSGRATASRWSAGLLALLWLWIAVVYHGLYFSDINPAAPIFATLFAAQAVLFTYSGVFRGSFRFGFRKDAAGITGALLLLYAIVIYPLLGILFSHSYPASPTFGLPCPTTIFTFGLLLWSNPPIPRHLLVIPVIWTVIASVAALRFGMYEDFGLIASAVLALLLGRFQEQPAGTRDQGPPLPIRQQTIRGMT